MGTNIRSTIIQKQELRVADQTIGIMSAMPEEVDSLLSEIKDQKEETFGQRRYIRGVLWGKNVVLSFSRWGKVAASTTASTLISRYHCSKIIFTGVAGGVAHGLGVGDIVIADQLLQHDLDARPIFEKYEVPLLNKSRFEADSTTRKALNLAAEAFLKNFDTHIPTESKLKFHIDHPKMCSGLIASGDKFFASHSELDDLRKDLPDVLCVEMEGAAMAQVCYEHEVPFAVIRTISDSADDEAHLDFQSFVTEVATQYSHGILQEYFARL